MTTRVPTPFGAAPAPSSVPVAFVTGDTNLTADINGNPVVRNWGIPEVASAPTVAPTAGSPCTLFCTADHKIYQYTAAGAWVASTALA